MSIIHQQGKLLHQEYDANDVLIEAVVPRRYEAQFAPFLDPLPEPRALEAWEMA